MRLNRVGGGQSDVTEAVESFKPPPRLKEKDEAPILDFALNNLTLGRAHLALALTSKFPPHPNPLPRPPSSHDPPASRGRGGKSRQDESDEALGQAAVHMDRAVELLRQASAEEFITRGLLARAALRRAQTDAQGALDDLKEAEQIAVRGRMRLYECDVHLERARLAIILERPGDARQRLERARRLIDETGYHRRDEDVLELDAIVREAEASLPDADDRVEAVEDDAMTSGDEGVVVIQRRRLQKLKEQAEYKGINAPAEVLMEIEDLEKKIVRLED
jgi:hypothetical protein